MYDELLYCAGQPSLTWFNAWDSSSWVLRAFNKLFQFGAVFDHSVSLRYTRLNLYSTEPQRLGSASAIFSRPSNRHLAKDIVKFYRRFQSYQSMADLTQSLLDDFPVVVGGMGFYVYYNQEFWLLVGNFPFFDVTYTDVPLPGVH